MSANIIWECRLDGRYECKVTRTDDRHGVLTMVDPDTDNAVLIDQPVGLSYGAIFGPDMDDVLHWEALCIEEADKHV